MAKKQLELFYNRTFIVMKFILTISCLIAFNIETYGQRVSPETELEKHALNIILNNFDSIPIYNFPYYKSHKKAKLYYLLFVDKDSTGLNKKIIDGIGKEYNIFDQNSFSIKPGEVKHFKTNDGINNNISIYPSTTNHQAKKGDLFIAVINKLQVGQYYYVLLQTSSTGSIVTGEILIKFDLNGTPIRIVTGQGEE